MRAALALNCTPTSDDRSAAIDRQAGASTKPLFPSIVSPDRISPELSRDLWRLWLSHMELRADVAPEDDFRKFDVGTHEIGPVGTHEFGPLCSRTDRMRRGSVLMSTDPPPPFRCRPSRRALCSPHEPQASVRDLPSLVPA